MRRLASPCEATIEDLLPADAAVSPRCHVTHLSAPIGGSDNHDAIDGNAKTSPVGAQAPVGTPATVVYASDLS